MPITPHIVVQGADRAAAFYREAFGADEVARIPTPDGRLMSVLAPPSVGGTPVVLGLDAADADAAFARALAAGAEVRQPLDDQFWGDRHGQVEDPFGHRWNISTHIRDVPQDEIIAAAARIFGGA